jgi:hypothetical protein
MAAFNRRRYRHLSPIALSALMAAVTSLALALSAAAKPPTKAQLPAMVLRDAALAAVAPRLPEHFTYWISADEAAVVTLDPTDTAADLQRRGWVAGYIRVRTAEPSASKGLLGVSTSVTLFRNAKAAAAAIERDLRDGKRLVGKSIEFGSLVSFTFTRVRSGGAAAVLARTHRISEGDDVFVTDAIVRVGQLRGRASVSRGDRRRADRIVLALAAKLRQRMVAAMRSG